MINQLIAERSENYNSDVANASSRLEFFKVKNICSPSDWIIMERILSAHGFTLNSSISGKNRYACNNKKPSSNISIITASFDLTFTILFASCNRSIQGFFPKSTIFTHSCAPNCFITMSSKLALKIRTSVDITRGAPLHVAHHPSVLYFGTKARQDHLKEIQGFNCQCSRCEDPIELGSNMSTWMCTNCRKCSLVLKTPLQSNERLCRECNFSIDSSKAQSLLVEHEYKLYNQINYTSSLDMSSQFVGFLKEVITNNSDINFHPNHWILIDCARKIVSFYGEDLGVLNSEEDHEIYIRLLKQLLHINDIIVPGLSRERGMESF